MKQPPALHISSREIETFVLDTQVPGQPAAGPGTFVGAGYVLDGLDSGNPFQGKIGKHFQANGAARGDCRLPRRFAHILPTWERANP
jgi:hypothetical protein